MKTHLKSPINLATSVRTEFQLLLHSPTMSIVRKITPSSCLVKFESWRFCLRKKQICTYIYRTIKLVWFPSWKILIARKVARFSCSWILCSLAERRGSEQSPIRSFVVDKLGEADCSEHLTLASPRETGCAASVDLKKTGEEPGSEKIAV